MSKMSTELTRHTLNGATMGTRWSALFFAPAGFDPVPLKAALQAVVDEVDEQMSTWKPESDLMRLNRTPVGEKVPLPQALMSVLTLALAIGRASGGAFDIAMGDAVAAWGFGPADADAAGIRAALAVPRCPAHEGLDLDIDAGWARKTVPLLLDLNGIAKGFGVDRLAETLQAFGITAGLVGIDGEMRAMGLRPDGKPWTIAVEEPDRTRRAAHSVLTLEGAAVATSGDYRHWVEVGGRHLSHTMDPRKGAPLAASPASVTVVARSCAEADAWATALMVRGPREGAELARQHRLDALFLLRDGERIVPRGVGPLFASPVAANPPTAA